MHTRPTVSVLGRGHQSQRTHIGHSRIARVIVDRHVCPTERHNRRRTIYSFRRFVFLRLRRRRRKQIVGHALARDGPPVRVAADVAPAAGRGLCRRSVSDERFPAGARKRLPDERRTVGRTTGKTVSAGRVPFGSGSRLRPVHVRNRSVCPKVLRAERCVREFEMHATERVGRNRQV